MFSLGDLFFNMLTLYILCINLHSVFILVGTGIVQLVSQLATEWMTEE